MAARSGRSRRLAQSGPFFSRRRYFLRPAIEPSATARQAAWWFGCESEKIAQFVLSGVRFLHLGLEEISQGFQDPLR